MKLKRSSIQGRLSGVHAIALVPGVIDWDEFCDISGYEINCDFEEYEVDPEISVQECPSCNNACPVIYWDDKKCPNCWKTVEQGLKEKGDDINNPDWFRKPHELWELFYDKNPDLEGFIE